MSSIAARAPRTVLVVDDERAVRDYARLVLEDAGHLVLTAADGREGLDLAERLGRRLHLLVTDVLMPVMDGHQLAARLRIRHPELPVVFTTGLGGDGSPSGVDATTPVVEAAVVLAKPYTGDQLEAVVDALLARGRDDRVATATPDAVAPALPL